MPIGERMRHARESRGLDIATVAEQLHLKQATVRALEEEDFSRLPARVFIRGYYRNYARLLELPEEKVLDDFDARCPDGEECTGAPPVVAREVRKEIRSSHGLVKLVSWLVVISLFAAFGLWWKDYSARQVVKEEAVPAVTHVQEQPNEPVAETVASQPEPPPATVTPGQPVAEPQDESAESAAPAVAARPAPVAEPTPTPEPEPEPERGTVKEKKVEMRFDQDSWVDVRGAEGSFKVVGTRKAGETLELGGRPPWKIIIGNARGVTLLVDGKPWDFSDRTRRNVARLTLEP